MTIRKMLLVAVAAILVATPAAHAQTSDAQPSFNCNYARTPDEVLICQNLNLADQDSQLAQFFYQLRNQMPVSLRHQLDREQASWLRHRMSCGRNAVCIAHAYEARMTDLGNRFCIHQRYDCTM